MIYYLLLNFDGRLRLIEQVATVCEQQQNDAVTNDTSTTSWRRHHDMRCVANKK